MIHNRKARIAARRADTVEKARLAWIPMLSA